LARALVRARERVAQGRGQSVDLAMLVPDAARFLGQTQA
jgi:hypothetical protein